MMRASTLMVDTGTCPTLLNHSTRTMYTEVALILSVANPQDEGGARAPRMVGTICEWGDR